MKLYLKYFIIHLKSQMQYKVSFFMTVLGQFLTSFSAFLGIYYLMQRFHQIDGFSYSEVLLCFSIVLMAFSSAECFVRGFDSFSSMIGNGEFDRILTRPRNVVFQVLGSKIEFSRIGRFLQALAVLAYALPASGLHWTPGKIATLLFMLIGGFVVFSGLFVIYAALCFYTTEGLEFINIFTDGGREFGGYPFSIYGEGILKFFTYVIPLALFQYYPLLYLTDKSSQKAFIFLPLLGFLFLLPCFILWKTGMSHYKSTGS